MASVFRWVVLPVLVVATVAMAAKAEDAKSEKASGEKGSAAAVQKPAVRVTISKETTYITEPLRPDGYPDYVAALNQRASKGVTPENNAAVLFWKAMGPSDIDEKDRKKYFEMLGMELLPEKGDYFIDYDDFLKKKQGERPSSVVPPSDGCDPLQDQYTTAQERPWSKEEFPEVYEWLKVNEKPLAVLIEASKRPRCYDPMIRDAVIDIPLMRLLQHRDTCRAFVARAMLRLHEGEVDQAWGDLLTCNRFARQVHESQLIIDALVAITIDGMAIPKDQVLIQHAKLSAKQIKDMQSDLGKLPPLPKVVDAIGVSERFMYLDLVMLMARNGLSEFKRLVQLRGDNSRKTVESCVDSIGNVVIEWDIVLRKGNIWYDRLTDTLRIPVRTKRMASMKIFNSDLNRMIDSTKDWKSLVFSMLGSPSKAISERVGGVILMFVLPGIHACVDAEDRATMNFELNKLAFALAAYRVDRGSYPAKLEELKPKYVAEVPKDIFANDGPLHYEVKDGGYLLYSVGVNGRDDGGKRIEDCDAEKPEGWDDLVVRMKGK